ncbi:hypothetical protein Acr_00g0004200 [Actinidia rufa]|uniref:Uncharacterized protein n=1 Tax=Actinidia rufa TaxID=165716 RepID=A0A7J0D7C6_9ERIC|nr:hypothetical protein Acr_00g0004200 [Actinidia rufa]
MRSFGSAPPAGERQLEQRNEERVEMHLTLPYGVRTMVRVPVLWGHFPHSLDRGNRKENKRWRLPRPSRFDSRRRLISSC